MNEVEKVEMTFTATICDESDAETKTILDGKLGDDLRKVLWTPEDAIAVVDSLTFGVHKLVNTNDLNSESTTFKGGVPIADRYLAFYPYSENVSLMWRGFDYAEPYSFVFTIPETQTYFPGSFATNSAPMVANAKLGEPLEFKNICGLLALNLTGSESIQSITFSGTDENGVSMYVSGNFLVHMGYQSDLSLEPAANYTANNWKSSKSVTLVCDEPVQLSESEATPFYFVLPPATYEKFTIIITTDDGKIMMKNGTKPLSIKRSDVQPTADLAYVETISINLSENGIANSYIVPQAGIYSFQANVIGNGELGLIKNANFHTTDPTITPASAELLWCEHEGAIYGVSYDESKGRVTFMASGQKGNGVIAVKDADGNILWSWHIWMTDQPAEHLYKNSTGEYIVLDRNLGATKAMFTDNETEWEEARGLVYQWGRKDPFVKDRFYEGMVNAPATYKTSYDQVSIETTIANPDTFYGVEHSFWINSSNASLWTRSKKTIYDPCPPGYKVAHNDVWRSFTKTENSHWGEYDKYNMSSVNRKGWNFFYDGSNVAYYPTTWRINIWGDYEGNENYVTLWSSENVNSTRSNTFRAYYYTESDSQVYPRDNHEDQTNGLAVRCMKDNEKSDMIITVTEVTDITSTSAQASAKIILYNGVDVIETGFVVGNSPEVCIEDGMVLSTDKQTGYISGQISGLNQMTKYYVKAYAIFANGITEYSQPKTFSTLSEDGTRLFSDPANCFIVNKAGKYAFEMLKGNSNEPISNAVKAEILWETNNKTTGVSKGNIVSSAEINENLVLFNIVESAEPGNALIAVKDSEDNILWSWHIWSVDFDPEDSAQIYSNGSVLMDRNLGAISATGGDTGSLGLMYQWGRKDPFMGGGDFNNTYAATTPSDAISHEYLPDATVEYGISHPTVVCDEPAWKNGHEDLWSRTKTIYDPCPAGWKVADNNAWEGWTGLSYNIKNYVEVYYGNTLAIYPTAGVTDGYGNLHMVNECGYIWSNTKYDAFRPAWNGDTHLTIYREGDNELSVRCQKID